MPFAVTANSHELKRNPVDETIPKGEVFRCDRCEYKANMKWNLKGHILSEHENKSFHCNLFNHEAKRSLFFIAVSMTTRQRQSRT